MMVTWNELSKRQRQAAEQTFDALETIDALTASQSEEGAAKSVGFADVYAFATGLNTAKDQDVRLALLRKPKLRQAFDAFLDQAAVYHFPRVASASTGDVETRDGDGFKIKLKRSKAVESQCYVIIDVDPNLGIEPRALFVKSIDGGIEKVVLPEDGAGNFQILSEWESDLVRALRDVKTEVYLR
jgi:hypothetical protein